MENGRAPKILIVDDELKNLDLLGTILKTNNYDFEIAINGIEAIEKVKTYGPDIILLDILMPEMDGFKACESLKNDPSTSHIPVMIITALDDKDSRLKGLTVGANDFLSKPIDIPEFTIKVRNLIRLKELEEVKIENEFLAKMITERRRVEEALRKERDFVSAILETSGALVVVLDQEGKIIRFNQACERTTGYSFNEVKGRHLWNFLLTAEEARVGPGDVPLQNAPVSAHFSGAPA